jgi:integrase
MRTWGPHLAQRLTDKVVRGLSAPAQGNKVFYDVDVKGFGCRVTAAGARSFVFNYRVRGTGTERRMTIGSYPAWSATHAKEKAKELRRRVDGGEDPLGSLQDLRATPSVVDLAERFIAEHVNKLRPHTQADHKSTIRADILPVLGKMKISAVGFEHVERLHAKITQRAPIRANRCVAVLGKMFNLAIKWKLRSDNPCKGIERNREHQRKRYLNPDELARLTAALAKDPNQDAADAFRLLLMTGARKGEVLGMQWDQLDLAGGTWVKPHTLTKQKSEHRVPLSAPARQLLARRHERSGGSPWIFPGRPGQHRHDLKFAWKRVCKAAGISRLRIHDLRHSHASFLVSAGFSLPTVAALLGHAQLTTASRYSHLLDDPLRQAAERVGAIVSGKGKAEIVPIKKRRRR